MKDSVKIRKLIWTRKQSGLKIFRVRNIGTLLLAVLALVAVLPVLFSITGSLMGQNELNDLLGAVLTSDSGSASGQTVNYVSWRVLPVYPTLKSYIKVLLDSPEFFENFCRSSGRTDPGWSTGSLGLCQIPFSGKKSVIYGLCSTDDDAISGNDAQ